MAKNKPTLTRIMSAYHTKITRGRRGARAVLINTNSSGGRAYSGRSAGEGSMMLEQRSDRQRLAGFLMCGAREQSADLSTGMPRDLPPPARKSLDNVRPAPYFSDRQ